MMETIEERIQKTALREIDYVVEYEREPIAITIIISENIVKDWIINQ